MLNNFQVEFSVSVQSIILLTACVPWMCSSILPALWRTSAQGTVWLTGPASAPGTTWTQE